ncbi:tautomerase family protein [Streptacidiphilus sp. P02-A3a]|uniref:tautomerase family protein n=1 Tax=Streptacidiphilus sp. P02-A3a TaxID=2704468 RepID=UPI0015FD14C5|nr:tautomerase family protein [Streptacidiphilus sp. P02-A3a]QMU67163.1 tautomerase family protein [Streptacidiphilus sp. P02-A3a]
MPLVQIDLADTRTPEARRAIASGVHRALVDTVGIPAGDRFQIITPHPADELVFDPDYLGVDRRDVVFVRITLVEGRPAQLKLKLHQQITANLTDAGVRPEDVLITLTDNALANWSLGNGEAQLAAQGSVPGAV